MSSMSCKEELDSAMERRELEPGEWTDCKRWKLACEKWRQCTKS